MPPKVLSKNTNWKSILLNAYFIDSQLFLELSIGLNMILSCSNTISEMFDILTKKLTSNSFVIQIELDALTDRLNFKSNAKLKLTDVEAVQCDTTPGAKKEKKRKVIRKRKKKK